MQKAIWVLVAGVGLVSSYAGAQNAPAPAQGAADPNRRICENITIVGSRLATKRICATQAEWDARRKEDQDTVNAVQRGRSACTTTGKGASSIC